MNIVISFFRLIRVTNLLLIALSLALFYYLILIPVHHYQLNTTFLPFTRVEFLLFVLSVVSVAAAGNIINDYFDFELDKEFKPNRPLAKGDISLDVAMYLHMVFAFAGIGLGFYLGYKNNDYKIGYIYVISILLLYLYSAFLKKIPLVGNIIISSLTALVFLLVLIFEAAFLRLVSFENGAYALAIIAAQVKFYAGFAFLTNLAREVIKDIEDREGDAAYNVNTVAVQFGEPIAKAVAVAALVLLFSSLSYFMLGFVQANTLMQLAYLLIAVQIPVLVLIALMLRAKNKQQYSRISLILKVVMLMGILSMPAFYFMTSTPQ